MLSYRHSFHAGNHGDVLKHWLLVTMLDYLNQKDKPYCYIDTHSGAGMYSLKSVYSQKVAEHTFGINKLLAAERLPDTLQRYVDVVRSFNSSGEVSIYPGSPLISQSLTRDQDRLRLFELHPSDARKLRDKFVRDSRAKVEDSDGFKGLKALLPPQEKRGLVMIDPSYEVKKDYSVVLQTIKDGLKRFEIGVYGIWYPLLKQVDNIQFQERIEKLEGAKWMNVKLIANSQPEAKGMYGSGMFIINPPWVLTQLLPEAMPILSNLIGQENSGDYLITDSGNL